mmetsp:Transcript_21744/g.67412  ORF Transcript_21744/g.67412 Transcript_21744/m.67412 type:complete len:231 (+) Transcript_21744:880-1572(+)
MTARTRCSWSSAATPSTRTSCASLSGRRAPTARRAMPGAARCTCASAKVEPAHQLGDADWLVARLRDDSDLDHVLTPLLRARDGRDGLGREQLDRRPDPRADDEWRRVPHAVHAIVEPGRHALERRHALRCEQVGKAHRQVAMDNRSAERRAALGRVARVDPLRVARRERERVHALLCDLKPAALAELLANGRAEGRAVHRGRARGPAAVVDAQGVDRRERANVRTPAHG